MLPAPCILLEIFYSSTSKYTHTHTQNSQIGELSNYRKGSNVGQPRTGTIYPLCKWKREQFSWVFPTESKTRKWNAGRRRESGFADLNMIRNLPQNKIIKQWNNCCRKLGAPCYYRNLSKCYMAISKRVLWKKIQFMSTGLWFYPSFEIGPLPQIIIFVCSTIF